MFTRNIHQMRLSVPTLFACLELNLKALFFVGVATFAGLGSASANSRPDLYPIPIQTIFAEQTFVYRVTAADSDGTVPGIRMLNAPAGATLQDNGDGSRTLTWVPPADVSAETVIILQAFDAVDASLVSTQRMVLRLSNGNDNTRPDTGPITDPALPNQGVENSADPAPINGDQSTAADSSNANAEQVSDTTPSNADGSINNPPSLPDIGTQLLQVDQDYQLYIRAMDVDGSIPGLRADGLPAGAVLEDGFDGSRVLRWKPTTGQEGEHRILFTAIDAEDASLTTNREIIFDVRDINGSTVQSIDSASNSLENDTPDNNTVLDEELVDSSIENAATENPAALPYFEPISAPVVSAGQTVSFRVVPRMPDKSAAILHVDRLPPNASFGDNYDGTRTFHWSTTQSDQGEHVFRFTAIHHSNLNQRVSTDVLIVVGDPAAPGSVPDRSSIENTAPKLIPLELQQVAVDKDLRFRVVATDNDGSVPSLYMENAPENVRFEDNGDGSREFYWTPSSDQSGTHEFNVVATDQADSSLTARMVITVNVIDTIGNNASPPPPELDKAARPTDQSQAARFLQRATFGPNAQSVSKLMEQTYSGWINDQMSIGQTRYLDGVDSVLREYGLFNITDGQRQFDRQQIRSDVFWDIAVNAPDQLRQRVAFALGQIMVVSDKDAGLDNRIRGIANYHDLLASEAFGNYRTLLGKVTINPMMGDFLSMRRNEKPDIENNIQSDENYAREMMQLFTLGLSQLHSNGQPVIGANAQPVPTYTQDDVVNLARVFTGWNYGDAGSMRSSTRSTQSEIMPMKSFESFHDKTDKTIVGGVDIPANMSAAAELELALDAIFRHPNVPPFVSKQLIQRLVTSNPSADYVQRVASVFSDNGDGVRGDMASVVTAILLDEEALNGHQQDQWAFGKLKEPVVKIASIWRAFDAKGKFGKLRYSGINADFLQNPYSAPSVFNFYSASYKPPGVIGNEGKVAPEAQILNDTTILRAADRLFDYAHEVPLGGANNSNQHTIVLNIDAEKALAKNVPELLDHLTSKLLSGSISDSLRSTLLELGEATPMTDNGEQRVRELLYVLFISPEFSVQR